jgi:tetratricopeptide (TPR) repeat protein
VDIVGLEPRRSDLARGILIARAAAPLDEQQQEAVWAALGRAGVTEPSESESDDAQARQWLAAPWLPPAAHEVDWQRAALEEIGASHGIERVWCVKLETGVDGVAWLEMGEAGGGEVEDDEDDADEDDEEQTLPEASATVLYAAPDAPPEPTVPEATEDDADDEDDAPDEADALLEDLLVESHWRNGAPPIEQLVEFPCERYPEIVDEYDPENFGVALKLAGAGLPGEESVINAFFALWLSAYQDERAPEFEAFQRADVVHDRGHRSALLWVERFSVPATAGEQVHFLLWILSRVHSILPIAWARFDTPDEATKSRAAGADGTPFVLAGNPFEDRFRRHGEDAALSWAVAQSAWSKRELAGMLVEVALEHDPDDPKTAVVAERLLRRALSFDPASDASGYLAIVLVRQERIPDAIALGKNAPAPDVRLLVVGELAEHAPDSLAPALSLLDAATLSASDSEEVADLVGTVARYAPADLEALLARLPKTAALVPHLYNASFAVERPQALSILRAVVALPPPEPGSGEARTAYVMAWNNACIHAHALHDYALAVQLADDGQPYAPENPYIYHSAACAYAAAGEIDRALAQVAAAIDHGYEHTEKMETDADLSPLQSDPRFHALFVEWRTRRADLN